MKQLFYLFILGLWSCSGDVKYPNVEHVDVQLDLKPFYQDLFRLKTDTTRQSLEKLQADYGEYLELYSRSIIHVGSTGDADYRTNLSHFLNYKPNQEVLATCDSVVAGLPELETELKQGFRYLKYHFPDIPIPTVYLHISGFNQNIFLDSLFVSVSVDKYLGKDNRFYQWLGVPSYLRAQMQPERIVPDVLKAMVYAWRPDVSGKEDLLHQMIYQAKVLYVLHHFLPDVSEASYMGFTPDQLKWCKKNEASMWSYVVENRHLYSTNRLNVVKFTGESPYTSFFGQESPGRALLYNGVQIVKAYMNQEPEITLEQLMDQSDAQLILQKSRYRP